MRGPDDRKVPTVERGNVGGAETLCNGDDGRIDRPERQVGVLADQPRRSPEVIGRELLDVEVAAGELGEEPGFGSGPKVVFDQLVRLDYDADRQDKPAGRARSARPSTRRGGRPRSLLPRC